MKIVNATAVLCLGLVMALCACGQSGLSRNGTGGTASGGEGKSAVQIAVLSNRADLISNEDALVQLVLPAGASAADLYVSLAGKDISSAFAKRTDGRVLGVVTGLVLGPNTLSAQLGNGPAATTTLIDHPNGGPVFSGPQAQPWTCPAGALDAQCNQPATYSYVYISTDPTKMGFQAYDPANPATDVANTTTDNGTVLPFIVRIETGYEDRDQYQIAALFQPGQPWTGPEPQAQFNHKLLITHGASCNVDYGSATAPSVTNYDPIALIGLPLSLPVRVLADSTKYALGAGFAVMSTALNNSGHDCHVAIQAESLMMAKEHLIETYGTLRYTIGTGCSGGSLAQQWIANAYPGIYQGILPTCSFPDTWTSATQVMDYHLMNLYFGTPVPGVGGTNTMAWTPTQIAAVEGNALPVDSVVSDLGFFDAVVPTHACGDISDAQRYDAATNPAGTRCSVADLGISVFAPRLPAVWSDNEKLLGRGFAGIPVDNVGVMYGLSALQTAQITPAQFVDLNAKIGGLSIDIVPTAARIAADTPALANAYRSGMINETTNMDRVAIIDCRGPDPGVAHDSYRAFAIRARLDRAHGGHVNQAIWEGPVPLVADTQCTLTSLQAMDRWLAAIEKDTTGTPIAQKIIADKPADIGDQCWDGAGTKLTDGLCGDVVVPVYGTPRTVAGDAITTDANKCQLKPLVASDNFGLLPFTTAQWTQLQGLFPDGVCDYSKPAVDQQGTVPWLTYQDATGAVIYGGQPLGAIPTNSGGGWSAPAFDAFGAAN